MSKYPRTLHLPWSKSISIDDRVSKSVDNLLNIEIIITEKLDGSNTSITKNGVYGRSHADFTRNPWDIKSWEIWQRIKKDLSEDMFLFGEGMYGIHSIEYTNLTSYFYIFGVRDNNIWVPWDKVEEYSYLLDIPTVPVLFRGVVSTEKELKDLTEKLASQPSELGGLREGIVVRSADMFHDDDFAKNVMKWVRKDHIQTDEHWTRNWVKAKINYDSKF
jgi:hypothetical protein